MRETIIRFLLIEPINDHPLVLWGMVVVWLVMIVACVMSLRQQFGMTRAARLGWVLLIVCLPIVGMALYLVRCVFRADYSFMKFIFGPSARVKRSFQNPRK